MPISAVTLLSDNDLLAHLDRLRRREHELTFQILCHLNEVERRNLHLVLGYGTMFDYCTQRLKYSESAAGRRIQAARCIRRFPVVERLLADNELNLSIVSSIAPILHEHNVDQVLAKVTGASRRDVEAVVANYKTPVVLRDRVKPVCVVVPAVELGENHSRGGSDRTAVELGENHSRGGSDPPRIEAKLFVQFLASREFMVKYERACALLSNRIGKPSFESVFLSLLDEFITRHSPEERHRRREERRRRVTASSTGDRPDDAGRGEGPGARRIPAAVHDAVHVRNNGRCAYVGRGGRRCRETRNLQIDHVKPVARGGTGDAGNLRLLCARHNRLEAERVLGREVINRGRRRTPGTRGR